MNRGSIIAIAGGAVLLFLYALWERRKNQRPCARCGSGVSKENPDPGCPRCRPPEKNEENVRVNSRRWIWSAWPTVVLVAVPLCVIVLDAVVLTQEGAQTDTELAIRLVKESASRKENFTVQQYLYTTLYHRRDKGEDVTISGWEAEGPQVGETGDVLVRFRYSEDRIAKAASWRVDLATRKIVPQDDIAREFSWN